MQVTVDSAKKAIEAFQSERTAYEKTLEIANLAIKQQQDLIATYREAIKQFQDMVKMMMDRVHNLENKIDKANTRTAILGILATVATIIASTRR